MQNKILFFLGYSLLLLLTANKAIHAFEEEIFEQEIFNAESDTVAFSRSAGQIYFSPRSLDFSTLPNKTQIRVATIETKQSIDSYGFSSTYYDIIKESRQHSLTALGVRGRGFERDPRNNLAPMVNYQIDLLLDFDFEFLQARTLVDFGVMWHPISGVLIGPAVGFSYSYFGSTMKFASEDELGGDVGEKDTLYVIRDQNTGQSYLLTLGPHNLGGYWGFYFEFAKIKFIEISAALLLRLFDVPFESNSELNVTLGSGRELASVGGASNLKLFMTDIRGTLHLKQLGIGITIPLIIGHRVMKYPSLGLREEGFYFGVALFK